MNNTKLRKQLKNFKDLQTQTKELIDNREITYEDRTERWQDSVKGEAYQDKTAELQDFVDNLDMAIESLETYLDD